MGIKFSQLMFPASLPVILTHSLTDKPSCGFERVSPSFAVGKNDAGWLGNAFEVMSGLQDDLVLGCDACNLQ